MDLFFWPRVAIGLALSLVLFAICLPVLMVYFVVTRIAAILCDASIDLSTQTAPPSLESHRSRLRFRSDFRTRRVTGSPTATYARRAGAEDAPRATPHCGKSLRGRISD
jgi:hypothetical protein